MDTICKSEFVKSLRGTKKTVYECLINHPQARDNDSWLEAKIWSEELRLMGKSTKTISAHELLTMQINGKLTSSLTIRRNRRKLNAEIPETRGKTYHHRQEEGKLTKEEINEE